MRKADQLTDKKNSEIAEEDEEEQDNDLIHEEEESGITDYNEEEEEDSNEVAAESNLKASTIKGNYPGPLIKQIKQEVMEEIISHEKTTTKHNKKNSSLNSLNKKKKVRKDKLLGNDEEVEADPPDTIDVTCGHLRGILHKELFYCPGIHRACVELEDGSFVTPKKFMFMGEKARLKDWKNAIRWNGHQLRKHIEAGTLHFYKHSELCTGRCMARSPYNTRDPFVNSKQRKEKFEFETLGFTTETQAMDTNGINSENLKFITTVEENGCMKIHSVSGGDHSLWDSNQKQEDDDPPDIKPDVEQLQLQMMNTMQGKLPTQPVHIAPKSQTLQLTNSLPTVIQSAKYTQPKPVPVEMPPSIMSAVMPPVSVSDSTEEEDRLLWQGIVELGLIDEFFREIKASLDLLKNTMVKRLVPVEDSNRISIIVRQLGLMKKLKFKLEAHRTDMDRQRRRLDREMIDLQRRVKEYEEKKRLLEKKSECFDQILEIPAMKNNVAVPMMVYPNQIQKPNNQSGPFSLAPSASVSSTSVTTSVSLTSNLSPVSNAPATIATSNLIPKASGGAKILVFPKQTTEFSSSPDGGLKITLKRKADFPTENSPPEKQKPSDSKISSLTKPSENTTECDEMSLSAINNGNSEESDTMNLRLDSEEGQYISPNDGVDSKPDDKNDDQDFLISENINTSEQNSHDDLNSSHEENMSTHSGSGDNQIDEKNENAVKRSTRKRSIKTYNDYIK